MNDKDIEQMLRESCSPQMPEGMRERVLRKSFDSLECRPPRRIANRWKPILACAAVLFVILANISDTMVQNKLAKDIGTSSISPETYLAWQRAVNEASVFSPIDSAEGDQL